MDCLLTKLQQLMLTFGRVLRVLIEWRQRAELRQRDLLLTLRGGRHVGRLPLHLRRQVTYMALNEAIILIGCLSVPNLLLCSKAPLLALLPA
jgi:hypothetical protein